MSKMGDRIFIDTNIVATMLVNNIPNILTHNISDFNRFSSEINIIPLI